MLFKNQLENLKKLNLPKSQFVIVGSGVLAVRGVREAKDIDIIVTDSLWNDLIKEHGVKNEYGFDFMDLGDNIEAIGKGSIFFNPSVVSFDEIFKKADNFDGINYMNLGQLKIIKFALGREKDLEDIMLINNCLKNK